MQRSHFTENYGNKRFAMEWADVLIPEGTHISKIEMMNNKQDSLMWGLKFFGSNGSVLLAVGYIDDLFRRMSPDFQVTSFNLKEDERLTGLKSCSYGCMNALHFNLQWIIGIEPAKFNLVKLLSNKKAACTERTICKLPEGVIREVIKYVQY